MICTIYVYVLIGRLIVSPQYGFEYRTIFTMTALFWDDQDLPLSYAFKYSVRSGDIKLVGVKSDSSVRYSTFPGISFPKMETNITIFVFVYDSADSFSTEESVITMSPQVNLKLNDVYEALDKMESNRGVEVTMTGSVMFSELLYISSCMNAPNCSALNRGACSNLIDMCGVCNPGFIGTLGYANTKCVDSGIAFVEDRNVSCLDDVDCFPWEKCSNSTSSCVEMNKPCVNDCSNHGDCRYYSIVLDQEVSTCFALDATCVPYCMCESSYGGKYCNIKAASFSDLSSLGNHLLGTVSQVSSNSTFLGDDVSYMQQSIIASLVLEPNYISSADMVNVLDMQKSILQFSSTYENIDTIVLKSLDTFDAFASNSILIKGTAAQRRRLLSADFSEQVESIFSLQAQSFKRLTDEMVPGQYPFEIVFSQYAYSFAVPAIGITPYVVQSPVSALQPFFSSLGKITAVFSNIGSNSKIGIVAVSQNVISRRLLSDMARVLISDSTLCKSITCNFYINFPFYASTSGYNITKTEETITVKCKSGLIAYHNVTCASSGVTTKVLCYGLSGYFFVNCQNYILPSCSYHSDALGLSGTCPIVSIANYSTNFSCSIRGGFMSNAVSDIQLQLTPVLLNKTDTAFLVTYSGDFVTPLQVFLVFGSILMMSLLFVLIDLFSNKAEKIANMKSDHAEPFDSLDLHKDLVSVMEGLFFSKMFVGAYSTRDALSRAMLSINLSNDYICILEGSNPLMILKVASKLILSSFTLLYIHVTLYGNNLETECWRRNQEDTCNYQISDVFQAYRRHCQWLPNPDPSMPSCVLSASNITQNSIVLLSLMTCSIMSMFNLFVDFVFDRFILVRDAMDSMNKIAPIDKTQILNEPYFIPERLNQVLMSWNRLVEDSAGEKLDADTLRRELTEIYMYYNEMGMGNEFQDSWGLSPGMIYSFVQYQLLNSVPKGRSKVNPAGQTIKSLYTTRFEYVTKRSAELRQRLNCISPEEQDFVMLLIFFMDLIGDYSVAGRIINNYYLQPLLMVCEKRQKNALIASVVLIDLILIGMAMYLAALTSSTGATDWLNSWMVGSLICFFVDLFVTSRFVSFITDFLLLNFTFETVLKAKKELRYHLNVMKRALINPEMSIKLFSSSKYLFVSHQLAKNDLVSANTRDYQVVTDDANTKLVRRPLRQLVNAVITSYKCDFPSFNIENKWAEVLNYKEGLLDFGDGARIVSLLSEIPRPVRYFMFNFIFSACLVISAYFLSMIYDLNSGIFVLFLIGISVILFMVLYFRSSTSVVPFDVSDVDAGGKDNSLREVSDVPTEYRDTAPTCCAQCRIIDSPLFDLYPCEHYKYMFCSTCIPQMLVRVPQCTICAKQEAVNLSSRSRAPPPLPPPDPPKLSPPPPNKEVIIRVLSTSIVKRALEDGAKFATEKIHIQRSVVRNLAQRLVRTPEDRVLTGNLADRLNARRNAPPNIFLDRGGMSANSALSNYSERARPKSMSSRSSSFEEDEYSDSSSFSNSNSGTFSDSDSNSDSQSGRYMRRSGNSDESYSRSTGSLLLSYSRESSFSSSGSSGDRSSFYSSDEGSVHSEEENKSFTKRPFDREKSLLEAAEADLLEAEIDSDFTYDSREFSDEDSDYSYSNDMDDSDRRSPSVKSTSHATGAEIDGTHDAGEGGALIAVIRDLQQSMHGAELQQLEQLEPPLQMQDVSSEKDHEISSISYVNRM